MSTLKTVCAHAILASAVLGHASAAQAQSSSYRVDADSSTTITLTLCNPVVQLRVDGDDDTDLDFTVRDNNGRVVHSDFGYSDETSVNLSAPNAGNGFCPDFKMEVQNLGDVYNQFTVNLTTVTAPQGRRSTIDGQSAGSFRVDSNSTWRRALRLCSPEVEFHIDGDNDTDLDFVIRDDRGNTVHTDNDTTDLTFGTLRTGLGGSGCRDFTLEVQNLGDVYNNMQVRLTDQ